MKLKVKLITIVDDNVVETLLSKFAMVTDPTANTAAVIPTDAVDIDGVTLRRDSGVFQVQIALGGYDSGGIFRRDLNYPTALISWGRQSHPECWTKYNLDTLTVINFDTIKGWLRTEESISTAGRVVWAFPTIEAQLTENDGTVVVDYKTKVKKIK